MASNNRNLRRTVGKLRRSLKKTQNELGEVDALLQETCDILSSKYDAPGSSDCIEKARRVPKPTTTSGSTQAHSKQSALQIHAGEDASTITPCVRHVDDHGATGPESILKEAQRFKRFWAKYQRLHNEISKAPSAVADSERDTLFVMHERLAEMKATISKSSSGREALRTSVGV